MLIVPMIAKAFANWYIFNKVIPCGKLIVIKKALIYNRSKLSRNSKVSIAASELTGI